MSHAELDSVRGPDDAQAGAATALRTAIVGVSVNPTCGVRAHGALLAEALGRGGVSCSVHWLGRSEHSILAARSQIRGWARGVATELQVSQPDAILLQYSIFDFSYRGLPLFVRPTLAALHRAGIPLITVLHELAYPWMYGGWRGNVWAFTQRAALIDTVRASAAVIVTADFRAQWLTSRRWLPQRPVAVAPVFSNLPAPGRRSPEDRQHPVIGLFGYSYESAAVSLVLDAIRLLHDRGMHAQLMLLGAPGRSSSSGETWLQAARARGVGESLSFSGVLASQALSDELAACDVLLFADTAGPSSRKGSLAGSLASGRPVVAIDGRRRWSELANSDAIRVTPPTAHELADATHALLLDEEEREALGARGRAFAETSMGVTRTANAVRTLLEDILAGRA